MSLPTKIQLTYVDDGRRSIYAAQDGRMPVFMSPIELSQFVGVVQAVGPRQVLEWGSGGSTALLLRLGAGIERLVSVEHNKAWFERVRSMVSDPRLDLRHVPSAIEEPVIPESLARKKRTPLLKAWFDRCENESSIMADYVALPGTLGTTFDLILVDGRARNACMKTGFELLRSGGVMVVHDAHRIEYRQTIESFAGHRFLEPWSQGQVCVIRKP